MSNHYDVLLVLLRESRLKSAYGLHNFIGIPMGLAFIFAPGLFLGAFLTQSRALLIASLLAIVLVVLFLISKLLDAQDNKKFVRTAVENGISKTEAEVFLKKVNWDEVFPEYE